MAKNETPSEIKGFKRCKTLSNYPTLRPTYTTFCIKNFSNQVDFHSEEKLPCKSTWYRDLKSTHIRNRRLLDLPYKTPKCCSDIYNVVLDRQKLKKLQKYGLTRPVRTPISDLEMEEVETCEPIETRPCESGEDTKITEATEAAEDTKAIIFPECYEVSDSGSDNEEDDEYEFCPSGSVSECSGCSTIGGGIRRKRHKIVKKNWRDLLHVAEAELCKSSVDSEIRKHKLGFNLTLKLKKVF